ncbi:MAG TPA: substrate-binding domain-containing protein [Actinomycetota bacterium]|nr:substrate-binding domain-containing protein [Actinomycetota bacterium]
MTKKPWSRVVLGALALSLVAVACGGDGGDNGGSGDGEQLTGELFISGSSTVEPVTSLVAEFFAEDQPGVSITVEGPGTSDGYELFCNGETDVQDSSRAIDEEEIAVCEEAGIEYVELYIAIDGMAVLTSPENPAPPACLNINDLYALIGPESEGFESWSDSDALGEEVGGIAVPYPDQPLEIIAPGEESGTYFSFIDLAIAGLAEAREQEEVTRPDYVASANDNVIVEGIAGSANSLGWVGYAFYQENQDVVEAIPVAPQDGAESDCVVASPETISSGEYPLSRPLFIYVNKELASQKPELVEFIDLYMSDEGLATAVSEVGYVEIDQTELEATRAAWEEFKASL